MLTDSTRDKSWSSLSQGVSCVMLGGSYNSYNSEARHSGSSTLFRMEIVEWSSSSCCIFPSSPL